MSNYISKNAIQNIPVAALPIQGNDELAQDYRLMSPLLKSDPNLVLLAKNDAIATRLKSGMATPSVRLIKLALITIDEMPLVYPDFNLTSTPDASTFDFDAALVSAVEQFQSWIGIPVTGIVDRYTLLAIDSKLFSTNLYDNKLTSYMGEAVSQQFNFVHSISSDGVYKLEVYFSKDDAPVTISTENPIQGKPIIKNNGEYIDDGKIAIKISSESEESIKQSYPEIGDLSIDNNRGFSLYIPAETTKMESDYNQGPIYTFVYDNIEDEVENTPPKLFNDPESKLYKVKSGDNLSSIVLDNYYGTGDYPIIDPYTNTTIYTLSGRTPFPTEHRGEDARFQFYLNLIYYFNSEETNGTLKEWGFKRVVADSGGMTRYDRYNVDHLDEVNIYDNTFDSSDPGTLTGLPNYYRFLKRMENLNSYSKIKFNASGDTTSFTPDAGENIWIPSRKFADSMYNMLNFRHDEMLEEIVIPPQNPGEDPSYIMGYITGAALANAISNMTNTSIFDQLINEVKNEAIELYNEVSEFMIQAYEFAINSLTQAWPRGIGGSFNIEAAVTWGIPVETGLVIDQRLWREVTKENELVIKYTKEAEVNIGAEVIVGAKGMFWSGKGRRKKKLGMDLGAGISGGHHFILNTEYEFPVRQEETGLLTMIIVVFAGEMVQATTEILAQLEIINIDPRQYISKFEVALEYKTEGWAAAQAGFDSGSGNNNVNFDSSPSISNGVETPAQQEENSSFASLDNIFQQIIGIEIEGSFCVGIGFTYEVKYDNNPRIFNKDARMFSSIDIEIKIYTQAVLNTGNLGNYLQQLFMSTTSSSNPFFSALNFDAGLSFGVQWHYERQARANEIELGDVNITDTPTVISVLSNGNLQFNTQGSERVIKQLGIFFTTYSGDVDTLCEPGTEAKILLNAGLLRQMWIQGSNFNFTLENVLSILREYEYKKKIGFFDFNTIKSDQKLTPRQKIVADKNLTGKARKVFKVGSSGSLELEAIDFLLKYAALPDGTSFGFYGALALNTQITLVMEELQLLVKFYIKKLYYKYVILNLGQRLIFDNEFKKHKKNIENNINLYYMENPTMDLPKGMDYYNLLYSDNVLFSGTTRAVNGLNKFIDDLLPEENNYLESLSRYVRSPKAFNDFFNGGIIREIDDIDYGVKDIVDAFSFLTSLINLEASLEAKAGIGVGGSIAVGEGATVKIAVGGMAEINFDGKLYEKGELTDLDINDPLRYIMQEIAELFELTDKDGRTGIKSALPLIEK